MLLTWWRKRTKAKANRTGYRRCLTPRQGARRLQLEWLEDRLALATHTWIGAVSNLWSNDANWQGGSPARDHNPDLVFLGGAKNLTNNNDLPGLDVVSITFSGSGGYTIGGNAITLTGSGAANAILLDNTATGTDALNFPLTLGLAQTWSVMNANATLVVGGNLTAGANAGISKTGPGTLALTGKNAGFQGNFTLSDGTVVVGNDIGTGTLKLSGSGGPTLFKASAPVKLPNRSVIVGDPPTIGGSNDITFTGPVTLTAGNTLIITNTATTTLAGIVSGAGGLTVAAGTVLLSTANIYTGTTTVNSGTLRAGAADAVPSASDVTVAGGATFDLNNFGDTIGSLAGAGMVSLGSGALTIGGTSTSATFSGVISGSGSLTKVGTSTQTLTGANIYSGGTTLRTGSLGVGNNSALGTGTLNLSGGVLQATAAVTLVNVFGVTGNTAVGGSSNLTLNGTGGLAAGHTLTVANTAMTTFGGMLNGAGSLAITAGSSGTVLLAVANSYSGTTALISGTLAVGSGSALGSSTLMITGGTLQSTGNATLANSFSVSGAGSLGGSNPLTLSGAGTLTSGALTISNTATTAILGALSGPGGLTVAAGTTGSLLLGTANNYSGATTLTSGTLIVGSIGALGTGSVALNGGTIQANVNGISLSNPFTVGGAATVGGSNSLTFNGSGNLGNTVTVTNTATTTFSASLSGSGALVEAVGTGSLLLSVGNSYSGGTTLIAGTLVVGDNSALGLGTLTLQGGMLQASTMVNLANSFLVTGPATAGGGNNLTFSGTGSLSATLTITDTGITTFSATLGGGGGLAEAAGTGSLLLGGNNSYSGGTTLTSGTLIVGSNSALGTSSVALNGGTIQGSVNNINLNNLFTVGGAAIVSGSTNLTFSGSGSLGNTLTVTNTATTTFSATLSGSGALAEVGGGNLILSGSNSYSGGTTVTSGVLTVANDSALGSGLVAVTNGNLQASTAVTLANSFNIGGPVSIGGSSNITFTGTITLTTGNLLLVANTATTTFSASIGGVGALDENGGGNLVLSAANAYTGGTILDSGTLTVGNNTALGTGMLVLNGGTLLATVSLSLPNAFTVNGSLVKIGGSNGVVFMGPGTLWTTLTVTNTATTTFAAPLGGSGSLTVIAGGGTVVLSAVNNFQGQTTITTGTLQQGAPGALSPSSSVVLMTGGILDLNSFNATIASLTGAGGVILGAGTLTTGGDNSSTVFSGILSGGGGLSKVGTGTFTLAGSSTYQGPTLVAQGTLRLAGNDTLPVTSSVTLMAGATLDFNAGQNDFLPGSSITGTGSVTFSGGTANISGTYDLTGSSTGTQVIGGAVNFLSPVTVISLGGALLISDGLANFSSGGTIAISSLTLSGGTLSGSDSILVQAQMSWTGGTMKGSGSTIIDSGNPLGAQLSIDDGVSPKVLQDNRTLRIPIGGNITWMGTGGIWVKGSGSINNAGTFNTMSGNHFVFTGDPGDMPQVNNSGTFISNGSIIVDSGVRFTNTGIVQIVSGILNIGDDYTQNSGSTAIATGAVLKTGGTVNINGGLLSGSGTVDGRVLNAGQIMPGDATTTGILTITGDYTQTPSGVLTIRIGGNDAGSGYDQLFIGGNATLDGTLNVNLINSFVPMSGSAFRILVFNSFSGAFANPNIDPSFPSFTLAYDPTDVSLQIN